MTEEELKKIERGLPFMQPEDYEAAIVELIEEIRSLRAQLHDALLNEPPFPDTPTTNSYEGKL